MVYVSDRIIQCIIFVPFFVCLKAGCMYALDMPKKYW